MPENKPANPIVRIFSLLRTGPRALRLRFYDQWMRLRRGYPVWPLSEITPQLYVGGQHYPKGWAWMTGRGITAVVNMREAWHDDTAGGIEGERHLHLVTRDNTPVALEDLHRGVAFITAEIERGGKVYVHCGIGVGRAPSMVAAYLISTGLTPDEALRKIKAVRPFIHLTSRQRQRLDEFAASLKEATP